MSGVRECSEMSTEYPPPREWYSRGYLPHFDRPDLIPSITFRLIDSLPVRFQEECDARLAHLPELERQTERNRMIDRRLDRGYGSCRLRDARVGRRVQDALLHFDGQRYRLLAWCIMPNHVHSLVEMCDGWPLPGVVHSWKSFTAVEANRLLGRTGPFWMREYHDRYIRDAEHLLNARRYIEANPVKAGLARSPEEWPWSSAAAILPDTGPPEESPRLPGRLPGG